MCVDFSPHQRRQVYHGNNQQTTLYTPFFVGQVHLFSTSLLTKLSRIQLYDRSDTENRYNFVVLKSSLNENLLPLLLIALNPIDIHDQEVKQNLCLYVLDV